MLEHEREQRDISQENSQLEFYFLLLSFLFFFKWIEKQMRKWQRKILSREVLFVRAKILFISLAFVVEKSFCLMGGSLKRGTTRERDEKQIHFNFDFNSHNKLSLSLSLTLLVSSCNCNSEFIVRSCK
jgi:hypothetical protein